MRRDRVVRQGQGAAHGALDDVDRVPVRLLAGGHDEHVARDNGVGRLLRGALCVLDRVGLGGAVPGRDLIQQLGHGLDLEGRAALPLRRVHRVEEGVAGGQGDRAGRDREDVDSPWRRDDRHGARDTVEVGLRDPRGRGRRWRWAGTGNGRRRYGDGDGESRQNGSQESQAGGVRHGARPLHLISPALRPRRSRTPENVVPGSAGRPRVAVSCRGLTWGKPVGRRLPVR